MTQLYDFSCNRIGARYYDAQLGAWISPDKARQYPNLYSYGANPLNGVDANGNDFLDDAGAALHDNMMQYVADHPLAFEFVADISTDASKYMGTASLGLLGTAGAAAVIPLTQPFTLPLLAGSGTLSIASATFGMVSDITNTSITGKVDKLDLTVNLVGIGSCGLGNKLEGLIKSWELAEGVEYSVQEYKATVVVNNTIGNAVGALGNYNSWFPIFQQQDQQTNLPPLPNSPCLTCQH